MIGKRVILSSEASTGHSSYDFAVIAASWGGLVKSVLVLAAIGAVIVIAQLRQLALELLNPFSAVVGTQSAATGRRLHSLQLLFELLNKCFEFLFCLSYRITSFNFSPCTRSLLWQILTVNPTCSRCLASSLVITLIIFGLDCLLLLLFAICLSCPISSVRFWVLACGGCCLGGFLGLFSLLLLVSLFLTIVRLLNITN